MTREAYNLGPTWRGALFYFSYWGVIGIFEPYLGVYLAPLLSGLLAGEIYDAFGPRAVFLVSLALVGKPILTRQIQYVMIYMYQYIVGLSQPETQVVELLAGTTQMPSV